MPEATAEAAAAVDMVLAGSQPNEKDSFKRCVTQKKWNTSSIESHEDQTLVGNYAGRSRGLDLDRETLLHCN